MQTALIRLFAIMPFLFGIGFLAPLIAQGLVACGLTEPLGVAPIAWGLAVGGGWGLYAALRGAWL